MKSSPSIRLTGEVVVVVNGVEVAMFSASDLFALSVEDLTTGRSLVMRAKSGSGFASWPVEEVGIPVSR